MARSFFSYSRVQNLVGALLRNNNIQKLRAPSHELANIGCGKNTKSGFINIDYSWHTEIDFCWDITKGLPLGSSCMDGIFTEHCLEHVNYNQCLEVLREIYRVLKGGGVARIIVPDGGLYLDLYHRYNSGEKVDFPYVDLQGLRDLAEDSRFGFTPMMAVNRIFRGYGHQFAYDYDTLRSLLLHVGFKSVTKSEFRKGEFKDLLIDSELRAPQSLFIEAIK